MTSSFLKDKVVVITGASSGIGEATAIAFAKQHCRLVLLARSIDKLNTVKENCQSIGAREVMVIPCDISDEQSCVSAIDLTIKQFQQIDVLINNAGISMRAMLADLHTDVLKKVMDVNFWGTVYATKYALPHIQLSKGSIIGVSSVAGFKGLPARTGYAASKFAMHGFLESLRIEQLKNNVHVGIICPGYTKSNIRNAALNQHAAPQGESPLDENALMSSEEVAQEIVDMVIKRKPFRVLTFKGKVTFWLNKFFPNWMDKMVFNLVSKEANSPFT